MDRKTPTRSSAAIFWCKATLLQFRRALQDYAQGIRRRPVGNGALFTVLLGESRTPLWDQTTVAERLLQQGKIQNLRCAVRSLNGAQLSPGSVFSFWKQIGQATHRRGYVPGRLLREGCLIPSVGGGLCQLSNALYEVALQAGLEIVERHAHSQMIPGSAAIHGRDATVAWNYIDLRFRADQAVVIQAFLTRDELVVRMFISPPAPEAGATHSASPVETLIHSGLALLDTSRTDAEAFDKTPSPTMAAHNCSDCGMTACFRHSRTAAQSNEEALQILPTINDSETALPNSVGSGRTAYLMDERWPEFRTYIGEHHTARDLLAVPLDGSRWRQPRYAWDTSGFAQVQTASFHTLRRSLSTRRLSQQGAARLRAQLHLTGDIAAGLARSLGPEISHVCVAQSLLPFLWRDGHLGGRSFEVFMTRLPLRHLHHVLDEALADHPERTTLGEYRAPAWMVEAEAEALAAADQVITPHRALAALFPGRIALLDWELPLGQSIPPSETAMQPKTIFFPGPTAARKGAYEVRSASQALGLTILLGGSELEGENFWDGLRTRRAEGGLRWNDVAAVVQPALVEDNPRPLLAALAAGIPVIASPACGLGERPGVFTVPYGDEATLRRALSHLVGASQP